MRREDEQGGLSPATWGHPAATRPREQMEGPRGTSSPKRLRRCREVKVKPGVGALGLARAPGPPGHRLALTRPPSAPALGLFFGDGARQQLGGGRGGRPARPRTKQGSPDGKSARKPQRGTSQIFPSGGFGPAARPAPASPPRLPAKKDARSPPGMLGPPPGRILLGPLRAGGSRVAPKGERWRCPALKMSPSGLSRGVWPGFGVLARQGAPPGIWGIWCLWGMQG